MEPRDDSAGRAPPTRVLMVCLGNICRSPMAHALLRHHAARRGAARAIEVDSAGTRPFHPGGPAHDGTLAVLRARGIDASGLVCRGVAAADFERFDRILAADLPVLRQLERIAPRGAPLELLLADGRGPIAEVPDPWYDGDFEGVFALLDAACATLTEQLLAARARDRSDRPLK